MKSKRMHIEFLQDIADNLEKAERFVDGMEFEEFLKDEKTRYSVICALEIVGEASKKVPSAIRQRYQEVPWKDMAGMRDRLVHGYFGVDSEIVWKTVRDFAPEIRSKMKYIIERERERLRKDY